jgi:transposase
LPAKELGCGSATTCWRRLDEWARAGVFEQLQALLLDELGEAGRIALERVSAVFMRWRCWPARSSASTRSSSRHGHEPSTDRAARSMMQECNACVGACKRRLPRDAGTA